MFTSQSVQCIQKFEGQRLLLSCEQMQNVSSRGVTGKAMYSMLLSEAHIPCKCMQNFRGDLYFTMTGKENFA
jgi:hypothetical protein